MLPFPGRVDGLDQNRDETSARDQLTSLGATLPLAYVTQYLEIMATEEEKPLPTPFWKVETSPGEYYYSGDRWKNLLALRKLITKLTDSERKLLVQRLISGEEFQVHIPIREYFRIDSFLPTLTLQ